MRALYTAGNQLPSSRREAPIVPATLVLCVKIKSKRRDVSVKAQSAQSKAVVGQVTINLAPTRRR